MSKTCIVTGGAGFIGSALSAGLVRRFDRVIAFDNLLAQVHGDTPRPPELDPAVELYRADVREAQAWTALLDTVDAVDTVIDLAAETGTGQSLFSATRHTSVNVVGTSRMMDALAQTGKLPRQLLLTSSRAIYGEGAWRSAEGEIFYPGQRTDAQLAAGQWDFPGAVYLPANAAWTQPHPTSVYGATKLCQEHLLKAWGGATGTQVKIVRLQNVYGPGQSLINAYTGIVPLFARMAKAGQSIPLYEDGQIVRDFVLIDDVRDAILAALDRDSAAGQTIDIGTGRMTTIADVAQVIARRYHAPAPHVSGDYRNGDVRCGACNGEPARRLLDFQARHGLEEGLNLLCQWIDATLGAA